ncbi:MAG TPA: diguanylate cyclase, partial [Terriglobales bacterium]
MQETRQVDRAEIARRFEKAEKFLQKGRADSALEEFLGILRDDPENDTVRQATADLYLTLGRKKEMIAMLGELFNRQVITADAAKATVTYKKLSRFAAPLPDQTWRYGQLIESSNQKEALQAYESSLSGFTGQRKKQEAFEVLKRIVVLDPKIDNLWRLAEFATELGDGKVAAEAYLQVAQTEEKGGGNAANWYERAYKADPQNPAVALGWGRTVLEQGDAETAVTILQPLATNGDNASPDAKDLFGRALLAAKRLKEAEPYVWELFVENPSRIHQVANLIAALVDAQQGGEAVTLARKLEADQRRRGERRAFVNLMKDIAEKHNSPPELLEYMVELFNSSNRENEYSQTLLKLFDVYVAAGNFAKAAECLDRAAEVDAYEPGHHARLESLRGKIDGKRFEVIASRFAPSKPATEAAATQLGVTEESAEASGLQDLILQAEILLQYGMRGKAMERLQKLQALYPKEEERNDDLRRLYMAAGIIPFTPPPMTAAPTAPPPPVVPAAPPAMRSGVVQTESPEISNLARVTEITRNLHRQGTTKGVLSTAVNDIGRLWGLARCVAAMSSPGKPPTAVLEYCAAGVKASELPSTVKLISLLQDLVVERGVLAIPNTANALELQPIQDLVSKLGIDSMMVIPMLDGQEHVGLLILEHKGAGREWPPSDIVVLRSIAEQMVMSVHNARLRRLVRNLSVTDEKSGLLKRSSYLDVLLSEVRRHLQQNSPLTILLMQFGKSSGLVKEFGEASVEAMMQQVGQLILGQIRQNDVAVRYDMTTVALILGDTAEKGAFLAMDKLRRVLEGIQVPGHNEAPVISVGIAEAVVRQQFDPADIVTEVINRAEDALTAARADANNHVHALA